MTEEHLIGVGSGVHTPHEQEYELEYGGAACMRMVLGSETVRCWDGVTTQAPAPTKTQVDLHAIAQGLNSPDEPADLWEIDPQGLKETLMAEKPACFENVFTIFTFAEGARGEANQKIIDTIHEWQVAPCVLVQDATQWLTVVGYRTNDASGSLESFFVNDPRPPISVGTGDPPDHEIPADVWNGTDVLNSDYYFQPVKAISSQWHDKLAMVCDPEPPKSSISVERQKPLADGKQLLSSEQIIEIAEKILKDRGIIKRKLYKQALEGCTLAKPQLVKILNKEDQFYYLLRYQIKGHDLAALAIDARFGTLLECIAYNKPVRLFRYQSGQIPQVLMRNPQLSESIEDIRERLVSHITSNYDSNNPSTIFNERFQNLLDKEILQARRQFIFNRLRREEISVHPTMVWQPSAQCISPLYPSYLVSTPKRNIYVRAADGLAFRDYIYPRMLRLGG